MGRQGARGSRPQRRCWSPGPPRQSAAAAAEAAVLAEGRHIRQREQRHKQRPPADIAAEGIEAVVDSAAVVAAGRRRGTARRTSRASAAAGPS